ncbi:hypothetical protein QBC39DRAFT_29212 [Podospora conica]|nr:hypothetical protein QBC39DRAFT_29212 [Schizothecium conicum]
MEPGGWFLERRFESRRSGRVLGGMSSPGEDGGDRESLFDSWDMNESTVMTRQLSVVLFLGIHHIPSGHRDTERDNMGFLFAVIGSPPHYGTPTPAQPSAYAAALHCTALLLLLLCCCCCAATAGYWRRTRGPDSLIGASGHPGPLCELEEPSNHPSRKAREGSVRTTSAPACLCLCCAKGQGSQGGLQFVTRKGDWNSNAHRRVFGSIPRFFRAILRAGLSLSLLCSRLSLQPFQAALPLPGACWWRACFRQLLGVGRAVTGDRCRGTDGGSDGGRALGGWNRRTIPGDGPYVNGGRGGAQQYRKPGDTTQGPGGTSVRRECGIFLSLLNWTPGLLGQAGPGLQGWIRIKIPARCRGAGSWAGHWGVVGVRLAAAKFGKPLWRGGRGGKGEGCTEGTDKETKYQVEEEEPGKRYITGHWNGRVARGGHCPKPYCRSSSLPW